MLGTFAAHAAGIPAELGGPRQQAVLARLLIARGQVVSADRIVEDLWTKVAPSRSLAGLQAYVSHLRRALEPDRAPRTAARLLVTAPPGYALRAGPDDVDAWRWEAAVAHAGELLAAGHARRARDTLADADRLWRGPAYARFTELPWAAAEAERLAALRAGAAERAADAAIRLGAAAEAAAALAAHTRAHPLREEGWRLLALALYRDGRQGEALAVLRRARAVLAEELGVDPGPALRRLEADVLAHAPHLDRPIDVEAHTVIRVFRADPPTRPRPEEAYADEPAGRGNPDGARAAVHTAASGSRPRAAHASSGPAPIFDAAAQDAPVAPFVGRAAQVARLLAASADVEAGRMGVVLVAGDPGAGKSALAEHIGRLLAARGWTHVLGRCPETAGAPPGWAWTQALRALLDRDPAAHRPAALARLLDDAGVPEPGGSGARFPREALDTYATLAGARFRGHEAVGDVLDRAAAAAPVLIVLDDLHRADDETLALLAHLARRNPRARVLILGTHRHTEDSAPFAETRAQIAAQVLDRLHLDGLGGDDIATLVRATLTRAVDPDTLAAIVERTDGNPLFVRETARLLEAEGALVAVSEVPAGVADVLRRRIARLPASARSVLRTASVIGRDVDVEVLLAVVDEDEDTVVDAVEAALVSGLVTEPGSGVVRFTHALVRDTLYADLSLLRRRRVHARVGAAIERVCPGEVAAAAHHFAQAPGPHAAARAVHWGRLAAAQAQHRFAHREAARLWRQVVDAYDRTADPRARERLELVLRLIPSVAYAGDLEAGRALRGAAIGEAATLGDIDLLARALVSFAVPMLWTNHNYGGHESEPIAAAHRVLAQLPDTDDELRCRTLITLALELEHVDRTAGDDVSGAALAMARRIGTPELLAAALNARAMYVYGIAEGTDLSDRTALGDELVALGSTHNLPGYQLVGHVLRMQVECVYGRLSNADHEAALARELAERHDMPLLGTITGWYRAFRLMVTGDVAAAEVAYARAAAELRHAGQWEHDRGMHYLATVLIRIDQGRIAELADVAGDVARVFPIAPAVEAHALALAAAGRVEEAVVVAAQRLPIIEDFLHTVSYVVRARLAIAIDDGGRARSAYDTLSRYADEITGGRTAAVVLWPVAHVLGDLARYLGLDPEVVAAHYDQAVVVATRAGANHWANAARSARDASPR